MEKKNEGVRIERKGRKDGKREGWNKREQGRSGIKNERGEGEKGGIKDEKRRKGRKRDRLSEGERRQKVR